LALACLFVNPICLHFAKTLTASTYCPNLMCLTSIYTPWEAFLLHYPLVPSQFQLWFQP
jgi:hypothetical protein